MGLFSVFNAAVCSETAPWQWSTNMENTTLKKPRDPPRMSQSARESPAANKSPVPPRLPAPTRQTGHHMSSQRPGGLILVFVSRALSSRGTLWQLSTLHSPDHRQAPKPLTPPSPLLPLPAPQDLAVPTLFLELICEVLGELVALSQGHKAVEALALEGVGVADHGGLGHGRVLHQGRLHLRRAQQVAWKRGEGKALHTCSKSPEAVKGPKLQI